MARCPVACFRDLEAGGPWLLAEWGESLGRSLGEPAPTSEQIREIANAVRTKGPAQPDAARRMEQLAVRHLAANAGLDIDSDGKGFVTSLPRNLEDAILLLNTAALTSQIRR